MGRVSHYRQNSSGLIAGVTKPGSASEDITIGYAGGRVSSITTAAGTMTYAFADSGSARTVTVTDGLSHVTTYIFDIPSQRMTSKTDALGHVTSWAYDTSGRLTDTTLPEGNTTHLTYDARGNVTQTRAVSKTPGTPADIVTSATFDATCANIATCNQPSSTTDANGNVTDYTYDPTHGGTLTVTLPAPTAGAIRPKTTLSYASLQAFYDSGSGIAASGYPTYRMVGISRCQTSATCAGTADEVKTTIGYGPQVAGTGNNLLPVAVTTGAGNGSLAATTAFGYDVIGNTISVDGPLSGAADTTIYRYDADRELVGVISPDPDGSGPLTPRAQRITYTPHGIATKKEIGTVNSSSDADWAAFSSLQQVTTTLDAADRKMQDVVTAGGTTYQIMQYSYDAASRLDCTALRMNSATWASLPSSACTLATTGSAGPDRITKTLYDNVNRTVQVLSAYGTADVATDATRTYSNNGKVSSLADAQGNLTTYEYDGDDRVVKVRYPNTTAGAGTSSTTDYEQFAYDPNGNVTSRHLRGYASDNTQHIDYTYDALNRVTLKDLPGTEPDVAYSYDSLGRTTSTYTAGNYVSIGYDALGRATSQTTPLGTIVMAYDLAGNRTTTAWPDSFYVNYDHLVTGEVSAIRENGATSGVGVLATYGYDALGRRTSVTRGNGTTTSYSFDAMSRLTSLTQDLAGTANDLSLGLGYNPAGQIASMTRSNDSYAWTSSVDQNLAYTVNGLNQMASVAGGTLSYDARGNLSSTGSNSYSYSSENLLLTGPGTTASYDPLLRLYETTGSATQFYAYDGAQRVAEYRGSGAMLRRYVFGPGDDEPLVWYEGSGTSDRRWLHADERGSVVAVTNSSGASIATNSYDEYGVPGSGNIGAFQYTGQVWLPDLGLYYYKARMYSSRLGRFMQTDPIGYGDGMNWYNYTGGDPVNRSDPSGTDSKWAWSCYGNCGGGYANSVLVDEFGVHSENFITNPDGSLTFTGARDDYYKYYSGGSFASLYLGGSGYSAFSQVGRFAGNSVMGGSSAAASAGTPKNGQQKIAEARKHGLCRLQGAIPFALDAASIIPGGGDAADLGRLGAGTVSLTISMAKGDSGNTALGTAGTGLAVVDGATKGASIGSSLVKDALEGIPIVGTVVGLGALYNDYAGASEDYNKCISGE
jgi:RHS repeat-associated protein